MPQVQARRSNARNRQVMSQWTSAAHASAFCILQAGQGRLTSRRRQKQRHPSRATSSSTHALPSDGRTAIGLEHTSHAVGAFGCHHPFVTQPSPPRMEKSAAALIFCVCRASTWRRLSPTAAQVHPPVVCPVLTYVALRREGAKGGRRMQQARSPAQTSQGKGKGRRRAHPAQPRQQEHKRGDNQRTR